MFKKVMAAVDFSAPALELLNAANDLKKMGMEELVVVHVVRPEAAERSIGNHRKRFLSRVDEKRKELSADGIKFKVIQPVGGPVEEIKELAEEENVNLILIGSIGEGSQFRDLLLGSTVANVIRVSKKPVLIEKYDKVDGKPIRKQIFRDGRSTTALLAADFSRSSLQAFDFILENPGQFDQVILFYVVDEGHSAEQVEENKQSAKAKLELWQQEFAEQGIEAEVCIKVGISSELIVKEAEKRDVSLIILSRRGRSRIEDLLIGSTADHVVRRAARPVLLLKG